MGRYDLVRTDLEWLVLDTRNRYMRVGSFATKAEALRWIRRAEGR